MNYKRVLLVVFLAGSACELEERIWSNPYDPRSDRSLWAPDSLVAYQESADKITLTWRRNGDDFDGFYIDKKIGENSWLEKIAELWDSVYTWTDTLDLKEVVANPVNYTYRVYAYADTNVSNAVGVTVLPDVPGAPEAVSVDTVFYDFTKMTVKWTPSPEDDFSAYTLFQASGQTGEKDSIYSTQDREVGSYELTDFDPTVENWFWIQVEDSTRQKTTGSGMGHTVDPPPEAVVLDTILYTQNTFSLSWSPSTVHDFKSYKVQQINIVDSSVVLLEAEFNDINQTTYQSVTDVDKEYFYRITVEDFWGLTAVGNIRGATSFPSIVVQTSLGDDGAGIDIQNLAPTVAAGKSLPALTGYFPLWIQGGKKIYAFHTYSAGMIMDADGEKLEVFSEFSNGGQPLNVGFNQNETMAVFSTTTDALYTLDLENRIFNQITFPDNNEKYGEPEFIDNGDRILCWKTEHQSNNNLGVRDILILDADGSNTQNLTLAVNFAEYTSGRMNGDGDTLVYVKKGEGVFIAARNDISNATKVSSNIPDPSPYFKNIRWSKDSSRILYWSGGNIYIFNSDGTGHRFFNAGRYADWSEEDSKIIFQFEWTSSSTSGKMYIKDSRATSDGVPDLLNDSPWAQLQPRQ